ncbi:MAG: DUF1501 domain-containing protein, partial [Planctomycetota bacterium]|nr:DUF1501 domain-containing protein [Planctomycetota bacterium]
PKGRGVDTGWVGRSVDSCCAGSSEPNLVVNLGTNVPYALRAEVHKAVSFQQPQAYRWNGNRKDAGVFDRLNEEGQGMTEAGWLRGVASSALKSSSAVREAAANYKPKAEYPAGRLAQDLRIVASLIAGGLPTRVFYVAMGGYDTHVRQKGRHNNLMNQLGRSVAAFHGDLAAHGLGGRVVTMAFSEFGRRLKENASGGTDHGVAGPMFVFGEKVRGGIYGEHPSLTDLDRGDLKLVTDFRSVYSTIIRHWLQTDPEKILGKPYPELGFLGPRRPRGWY